MSGQPARPPQQQQGGTAATYGAPNQYPGQRPAMQYMPRNGQGQPVSVPWAGAGALPVYSSTAPRSQQAPDGRLSDLLTSAHSGRPVQAMNQTVTSGQQPRPALPGQMAARPGGQPGYAAAPLMSAAAQPMQQGQQPGRVSTPTPPYLAGPAYRPPVSGGQPPVYSQGLQPGQQQLQRAQSPMPPRPTIVQQAGYPTTNLYQAAPSTAAIAQQYQAIVSQMRPHYAAVVQPGQYVVPQLSDEDRKVLPKKSLKRKATAATGDSTAEMDEALEKALVQVADDFITGAVAFASGLAKRRKSNKLEAADVAVYLERNWQLQVPGFSGAQVKPYRRPAPKELHLTRAAVVRKETAAAGDTAAAVAAEKAKAEAESNAAQASAPSLLPD